MSARRHAAIAALLLLSFSAETPAPDHQVPDAARREGRGGTGADASGTTLLRLLETQTDAINALNDKLNSIESRVTSLEKEKRNG
jgi:hypothetical protein